MCTCGHPDPHEVARRCTADGCTVVLWSDGVISGLLGCRFPGVPLGRSRTPEARAVALAAGWMLAGEVELYDADEVPDLLAACRWAAERGADVVAMRARLHAPARLQPDWQVYQADRAGRPTLRVWRLPRLRWPGLAVFDTCGAALRYELMHVHRGGRGEEWCTTTGFKFATLAALQAHLESIRSA